MKNVPAGCQKEKEALFDAAMELYVATHNGGDVHQKLNVLGSIAIEFGAKVTEKMKAKNDHQG